MVKPLPFLNRILRPSLAELVDTCRVTPLSAWPTSSPLYAWIEKYLNETAALSIVATSVMGKHKDSIEQISKPTDVAHIATGAGYHDDLATMSILSEPILVHELQVIPPILLGRKLSHRAQLEPFDSVWSLTLSVLCRHGSIRISFVRHIIALYITCILVNHTLI